MKRVLVAEDDADLRDLATMLLSLSGCAVTAVADGGAAAAALDDGEVFDVLVLDHSMPGLTGVEVAQRARAVGHGGRIVLWTGWVGAVTPTDVRRHDLLLLHKHDAIELVAVVTADDGGVTLPSE